MASETGTVAFKPFLNGMRSPVVGPLTRFLIGIPLVLLTTRTARYFAWTINPSMTAGFLGANYWASALLALLAAALIPLGIALFLAPGTVARLWPWALPTLSAQVVAAWVLALGVLAAHTIYENDHARVHSAMLAYPFLGAMQVLMLVRFSEDVRWDDPSAWVYVGVIASFFVLRAYWLIVRSRSSALAS